MRILLTNDDGINADGLHALYKELRKIGNVLVVAPETEQSSVGHGVTLAKPISCRKIKKNNKAFGYAVTGTPADCVKLAAGLIFKKKPDIVVSGINLGSNDGCSVYYSGTVAAAREGAMMGIPSFAISLDTYAKPDFRFAAQCGRKIASFLLSINVPTGTFLNVNVPNIKSSQIKGTIITTQGMVPIQAKFKRNAKPEFDGNYWMTGKLPPQKNDLSVDTYALRKNYVTITPVKSDSTDYNYLYDMQSRKINI